MCSSSAGDENSHGVIKSKVISVKIDGTETDKVLNDYRDRRFIILIQYKKLGFLIAVCKATANTDSICSEVYQVRTILGQEETNFHVAARYLTEQTQMNKPALHSIALKDCSLRTLRTIKDIIMQNKLW